MDANSCPPKHVVIVMDVLEEFSAEPIEWVLKNIPLKGCCTITLLGVSPRLNILMSSKSRNMGIWTMRLEDLLATKEESDEWKNDDKFRQFQQLVELCQKYEVFPPQMSVLMGYPLKVIVAEKIESLNATLAVLDKNHDRKNIEYYTKKAPCDIIVLGADDQVVDIIKGQSHVTIEEYIDHTPSDAISTSII